MTRGITLDKRARRTSSAQLLHRTLIFSIALILEGEMPPVTPKALMNGTAYGSALSASRRRLITEVSRWAW
jgi:hypothetical protein